jgi:hypothetical protein
VKNLANSSTQQGSDIGPPTFPPPAGRTEEIGPDELSRPDALVPKSR